MQDLLFTSTLSSIITLGVLFAVFIAVVQDNFFFPSLLLIIGVMVLFFTRRDDLWNTLTNSQALAWIAACYIPIGLAFGIFQYRRMLLKLKKQSRVTDHHEPSQHKADITGWIIYWPFALLGNMIGFFMIDLLCNIRDWLYNSFKGIFQGVYERNK